MINFWIIGFPAFSIRITRRSRSQALNWLNFEKINGVVELLYESNVLQAEVSENDFVVITAGQFWPDDIIIAI